MARLPVGQNHDAGAQLAQHAHDLDAIFKGVFDRAVGQVERLPPADAEQTRGFSGFARRAPPRCRGFRLRPG